MTQRARSRNPGGCTLPRTRDVRRADRVSQAEVVRPANAMPQQRWQPSAREQDGRPAAHGVTTTTTTAPQRAKLLRVHMTSHEICES